MSALILVVDDEADIEPLFKQQFRRDLKAGRFQMAFAASGPDALSFIEGAQDVRIILLLSDINMPGMSGLDLLATVKSARPDLPVLMISAYSDMDTRSRAAAAGAVGLVSKPIDFEHLRREVDALLPHSGDA
ncbi:response regulator [uncultured Alsobacter sp.]|uniref:response regulator n=1 Tax=uncultured Alsobacter sp. TaxID=1748258 RepID=UPI0025FA4A17|nr:response regulator [uncultured Alsobacter sp.]